MDTFIMLKRNGETKELMKDKNAFMLLSVIAYRARRTIAFNIRGLKPGEALIGDHNNYGLSQREYRTAKKHLKNWKLATFKATTKGTIATLADTRIYDINSDLGDKQKDKPETSKRQAGDKQATTNNNVNNENNDNNDNIYTLLQCENEFFKQGGTDEDAKGFFTHYDSQGWLKGNKLPITSLSSQVTNWRLNPKQYEVKEDDKQDKIRKAMQYAKESKDRREGRGTLAEIVPDGVGVTGEGVF